MKFCVVFYKEKSIFMELEYGEADFVAYQKAGALQGGKWASVDT